MEVFGKRGSGILFQVIVFKKWRVAINAFFWEYLTHCGYHCQPMYKIAFGWWVVTAVVGCLLRTAQSNESEANVKVYK